MSARVLVACAVVVSAMAIACSSDDSPTPGPERATTSGERAATTADVATSTTTTDSTTTTAPLPPLVPADDATMDAIVIQLGSSPPGCDPLDVRACVLPFPSDATTVDDPATTTGRRLAFPAQGLPTNATGAAIDVAPWNRNDGFSPNSPILAWFDDLDPDASRLPPWTDLQASLAPDALVAVVDVGTGERVPLWAEIDPDAAGATGHLLVIHPAISLEAATTYAVGIRGLATTEGTPVEPTAVFRALRDRLATDVGVIEAQRDAMEEAFHALGRADVARDELQLAWTFTTASTDNTTRAILAMRDETLGGLEDAAPEFQIIVVTDDPAPGIARLVEGTFSVPNWLTLDGGPGTALNAGPGGLPEINGVRQAPFACVIGDAVADGSGPADAVVYGHGLLGSHLEVVAADIVAMSNEHEALHCATKWAGFSDDDVSTAVAAVEDLSAFPTFVDRMHQGIIDQLVLGRLMLADNGLVGEPSFLRDDGSPMLDNAALSYDGNSQGAIMGMALVALSTDIERAVLGVAGMNYSTLLPRSVAFAPFEEIFLPAYPDPVDRAIALGVAQILWDRTDGAGYVRHLVDDPLPGTPPKDVLLHVAFGDWQVSELTAMVAARTASIPIHRPVTAPGRSREVEPGWGIDTLGTTGSSALVIWDSGSDPIPFEATPPDTSRDPHDDPRNDGEVRRQKAAFLFDGEVIDVCDAGPCAVVPAG